MAGSGGTFLDDSTPVDHGMENDDGEDPHDLSFSSDHILRASMVDNLVMSLDQFSSANFDTSPYTLRSNSYDPDMQGRTRGHTFSSSMSSEADIHEVRGLPQFPPSSTSRGFRRNSVKYQKNLQRLPSIFGEDEDAARAKVYDAQRAEQPPPRRRRKNLSGGGKSNASSASSSIDLGRLANLTGRFGAAGSRRSRSFDFGSRQRINRALTTTTATTITDAADGAPTPVIFSGPDAQTGLDSSTPGPAIARKNSTKSSKSTYAKKGRSGTLGTSVLRPSIHDPVPQLPTMKSGSNLTHAAGPPAPEIITTARPGFFRRVFGSSKTSVPHSDSVSSQNSNHLKPSPGPTSPVQDDHHRPGSPTAKLQKPVRRVSTDNLANKENHPVVTKKTSTFFRRRKKSTSNSNNLPPPPPPLPLTINPELKPDNDPTVDLSPVSSLRAFMEPFLNENRPLSKGHGRTSSMQGPYTPAKMPAAGLGTFHEPPSRFDPVGHRRHESHGSANTLKTSSKPGSTLRIPHQDSFLADSSSTDEPCKKSTFDASSVSDMEASESKVPPSEKSWRPEAVAASASTLAVPSRSFQQDSIKSDKLAPTASHSRQSLDPAASETSKQPAPSKASSSLNLARKGSKGSPWASGSDLSEYRSAPSTPLVIEGPEIGDDRSVSVHVVRPSISENDLNELVKRRAQQIFDNTDDEVNSSSAGAWLGEAGREREQIRRAYMELFDWSNQNILESLRGLCDRIILKGETQQVDRLLDAFARRWCECNRRHAFKSSGTSSSASSLVFSPLTRVDVVHTICYSLLLLNTDLHLADIGQKMTKVQFVRNALPTIKRVAQGSDADSTLRAALPAGITTAARDHSRSRTSTDHDNTGTVRLSKRQVDRLHPDDFLHAEPAHGAGAQLTDSSSMAVLSRGWDSHIEAVLRSFYSSISQEPLPLFGSQAESAAVTPSNNFLSLGNNMLRRTPSTLSKAHSDTSRGRLGPESRSLGTRWASKARSRPRLPSAAGFGSSRTSLDEQSSAWSPSMSSTWSKASLAKTLTSMSVDSFSTEAPYADYQSSIGFANALSQAIIRDDQMELPTEEGLKSASLLEDESLELCGAPWAKEGILKHKCHLDGADKKSKDRNWNDCFAVIEKGWMRLFSFSMTAKSLRNKARTPKAGAVVGGGNWQDNAEEIWKFMLRHTIASALPPPGYSKARPYVWALSLPNGAVHLFSVGTPEIIKEFVTTANFWSARLSKEPMMSGVSNMEYGWSDAVINRALISSESHTTLNGPTSPRPSTQMSMRSSFDHVGGMRPKLPGDRIYINDWNPPQQSMFASQLMEVDQLKALQHYVDHIENELQKHNELRGPMILAFSTKHPNYSKAMGNWEKKSSYLLREIVKFRTYIDTLQNAQATKDKIYKTREEEEARRAEIDSQVQNTTAAT